MIQSKIMQAIFLLIFIFFNACSDEHNENNMEQVQVNFFDTNNPGLNTASITNEEKLYVAVSAMTSPKETINHYKRLISYLSKKIGIPIEFKQRKTYQEVNDLLEKRKLDFAFICSGAYVEAQDKFPIELLAVPVVNGKPKYYAYVIVHKSSTYQNFSDLKGKSFAFTDPLSNTGRLYVMYLLNKIQTNEDRYFTQTMYTYAHDYSIQAVSRQLVDGATVDGLIVEYYKKFHPERVENIRVIKKSEDFGIPPIVIPKGVDPEIKTKLRHILFIMDKDTLGKEILETLMIDNFIKGDDEDYQSIREMRRNTKE